MTNEFSHLTEEIDKLTELSKGISIDVTYTLSAHHLDIFIYIQGARIELNYYKIDSSIFNNLGEEKTIASIITEIKQRLISISTVCKAMAELM